MHNKQHQVWEEIKKKLDVVVECSEINEWVLWHGKNKNDKMQKKTLTNV